VNAETRFSIVNLREPPKSSSGDSARPGVTNAAWVRACDVAERTTRGSNRLAKRTGREYQGVRTLGARRVYPQARLAVPARVGPGIVGQLLLLGPIDASVERSTAWLLVASRLQRSAARRRPLHSQSSESFNFLEDLVGLERLLICGLKVRFLRGSPPNVLLVHLHLLPQVRPSSAWPSASDCWFETPVPQPCARVAHRCG
jgi:hypothetical protein